MTTRDVGDRINLRYEARDPDGTLVAATMALAVTDPSGDVTNPTITNTATGIYDAAFTLTEVSPLPWRWTWTASGTVVDVQSGEVFAADPGPGTYGTLAQLRKRITGSSDGDRDDLMQDALSAAARAFDRETGRRAGGFELARTATQRIFPVGRRVVYDNATGRFKLLIDEIGSADGLIVETGGDSTWTAITDYRVEPRNALADREPVTGLSSRAGWGTDEVRVTARWGWPAVPDDVVTAVLIAAHRLYLRKDSPDGTRGGGSDFGAIRIARIDPDVDKALKDFQLPGIG